MHYPKAAIIMINYKYYAKRFLKKSYLSLRKLNYPKDKYQIYVADNASSKETVELCKKLAPEAKVIASNGNGWGHANNYCAKQAEKDECEYFFFVNMDTEFDPDFISQAIKVYESDKKIGVVQSKLLLHPPVNGEYMLNSKGNNMTFLGFGYCAGDGKKDDAKDEPLEIAYASGAGLLIHKDLFKKIGRCDESLFMYHDDAEICFKAKIMGHICVLAPKSIIYHKHEFDRSISKIYYMERNRIRFLFEFYKWQTLLLILPAFILMELGMLPYSIVNKWFITKLRAYTYFLKPKNIACLARKRQKIQKLRKITDKELLRLSKADIEFQQIQNPVLKYIANPFFKIYWKTAKRIIAW